MSYPKKHRLDSGYVLYMKGKTVKILFYDGEEVHAEVTNSTGDEELVSCVLSYFRCTCTDWFNRHELLEGGYLCKHCLALIFEIGYRKANNLEMVG